MTTSQTHATSVLRGRHFPAESVQSMQGRVATATEVENALRTTFAGKFFSNNIIRMGDTNYYLPSQGEVQQILDASEVAKGERRWIAERYDCDDFSYVLKGEFSTVACFNKGMLYGFAFGLIWANFSHVAGFHAINLVMTSDGEIRLIEPQGNLMYDASVCQSDISIILI